MYVFRHALRVTTYIYIATLRDDVPNLCGLEWKQERNLVEFIQVVECRLPDDVC